MINIDFVKVKVYRNTGSNKVTRILFVYTNKEAADWEYAYFVESGQRTTVRVLTKDIAVNVPSG